MFELELCIIGKKEVAARMRLNLSNKVSLSVIFGLMRIIVKNGGGIF